MYADMHCYVFRYRVKTTPVAENWFSAKSIQIICLECQIILMLTESYDLNHKKTCVFCQKNIKPVFSVKKTSNFKDI